MKISFVTRTLIVCLIVTAGCSERAGTVVLVNRSRNEVQLAQVSICGKTAEVEAIPAGESRQLDLAPSCESHFSVTVALSTGRELSGEVGYTTPGLPMRNEIVVQENEIEFQAVKLK